MSDDGTGRRHRPVTASWWARGSKNPISSAMSRSRASSSSARSHALSSRWAGGRSIVTLGAANRIGRGESRTGAVELVDPLDVTEVVGKPLLECGLKRFEPANRGASWQSDRSSRVSGPARHANVTTGAQRHLTTRASAAGDRPPLNTYRKLVLVHAVAGFGSTTAHAPPNAAAAVGSPTWGADTPATCTMEYSTRPTGAADKRHKVRTLSLGSR